MDRVIPKFGQPTEFIIRDRKNFDEMKLAPI